MITHLYNGTVRFEDGWYLINIYFKNENDEDMNTCFGWLYVPSAEEISARVTEFMEAYV